MIKDHKIRIAGVIELRELMLVSVFSIPINRVQLEMF
jgi:hypothetical protein